MVVIDISVLYLVFCVKYAYIILSIKEYVSRLLQKIYEIIENLLTLSLKFDNLEKVSTGEGITQRKKLGKREGRRFIE